VNGDGIASGRACPEYDIYEIVEKQRRSRTACIAVWLPIGDQRERLVGATKITRITGVADFVTLDCRFGDEDMNLAIGEGRLRLRSGRTTLITPRRKGDPLSKAHPLLLYDALTRGAELGLTAVTLDVADGVTELRVGRRHPKKSGASEGALNLDTPARIWVNAHGDITRMAHYDCDDIHVVDVWDHGVPKKRQDR
jgi:hypothetical protein